MPDQFGSGEQRREYRSGGSKVTVQEAASRSTQNAMANAIVAQCQCQCQQTWPELKLGESVGGESEN